MSLLGWQNPLQTQDGSSLPDRAQTRCPFPFALMWMSINAAAEYWRVQISFYGRNRFSLKSAPYKKGQVRQRGLGKCTDFLCSHHRLLNQCSCRSSKCLKLAEMNHTFLSHFPVQNGNHKAWLSYRRDVKGSK